MNRLFLLILSVFQITYASNRFLFTTMLSALNTQLQVPSNLNSSTNSTPMKIEELTSNDDSEAGESEKMNDIQGYLQSLSKAQHSLEDSHRQLIALRFRDVTTILLINKRRGFEKIFAQQQDLKKILSPAFDPYFFRSEKFLCFLIGKKQDHCQSIKDFMFLEQEKYYENTQSEISARKMALFLSGKVANMTYYAPERWQIFNAIMLETDIKSPTCGDLLLVDMSTNFYSMKAGSIGNRASVINHWLQHDGPDLVTKLQHQSQNNNLTINISHSLIHERIPTGSMKDLYDCLEVIVQCLHAKKSSIFDLTDFEEEDSGTYYEIQLFTMIHSRKEDMDGSMIRTSSIIG
jgi:hypothetical protein